MHRWVNKVAIVTGASSGIGKAVSKSLVQEGLIVIGLARSLEKMEEFGNKMKNNKGTFFPIKCDVTKEEDILKVFTYIKNKFESVNILINNAGILLDGKISESSTESYKKVMDTNLIAPAIFTRESLKIMREKNVPGHIININSIVGKSSEPVVGFFRNLYGPSKFALTAMTQLLETELTNVGSAIKVTSIHPGITKTELISNAILKKEPYIEAEDVADSIIYALSTPPHVQVKEIMITPVPGYRRAIN